MNPVSDGHCLKAAAGSVVLAGIAAMLTVLTVLPAPAHASGNGTSCKARMPDLVVSDADFSGRPYVFYAEKSNASVKDTTRNRCSGRAGPSVTRVRLVHGDRAIRLAARAVPELPRGQESAGVSSDPNRPRPYPLGAYTVWVCADDTNMVDESDEANNCRQIPNLRFTVAARFWKGMVSGLESGFVGGDVMERARSTNALFRFDQYLGEGSFAYEFSGTVTWTDSGSSGDCRWSGTGTRTYSRANPPAGGGLTVDYPSQKYGGDAYESRQGFYNITLTCDGSTSRTPGPFLTHFWTPGNAEAFQFGTQALRGTHALSAQPVSWIWRWDLDLAVPAN